MFRDQKPDSINPKRSSFLRVTKVWESPSFDTPGMLTIKVKLENGIKEFVLSEYDPTQISVNVFEFLGKSFKDATEIILEKKRKYQTMIDLIMPED